ncbi:hypothetical protein ABZ883_37185 [Streptomyces sp. NPDC046977]|uniref:hypothetical protein n=1 Tax=Streptomyces sp. NPDC046977 TaxID=3154703 RepID=UPI0033EE5F9B
MEHTASVRRPVAAALATHGLAFIALIVLPFDGLLAQIIIGLVAGIIGGILGPRVAARLSGSNS